ncbi:MAG: cbb3-type cytochrome oxidase subunit 3 [Gammaproteobacteria bacterium]|nr:cbb3-type cytochrome oxidase subunit 3 [Gammaproteobacteria bacterium]MBL6999116.1 cbb3-type cytochrome oxidase subunit 3 [Gammaproteobacteria bacterium]
MMTSLMHSIWTVVVFIVFIGIVLWAYSANRKKDFDEASRLALDDDEPSDDSTKKAD